MIKLNKGEPCRVRLHTGEVVDAVYDKPTGIPKAHTLRRNGDFLIALRNPHFSWECRFVGPACDLVPVEVSV